MKILEYNVPHGKLNRGMTVVNTYNHLTGDKFKTEEGLIVANYLGWCVEMVNKQLFFSFLHQELYCLKSLIDKHVVTK